MTLEPSPDGDVSSEVGPPEPTSVEGISGELVVGESDAVDESVPVDGGVKGVSGELESGDAGPSEELAEEDEEVPDDVPSVDDAPEPDAASSFNSPQLTVMYSPFISSSKLSPGTAITTT